MAYVVFLSQPTMELYIREPLVPDEEPEDTFKTPGEARHFNDVKIRQNLGADGRPFFIATTRTGERILIFWSRVAWIQRVPDEELDKRIAEAKARAEALEEAQRPREEGLQRQEEARQARIAAAGIIPRIPGGRFGRG